MLDKQVKSESSTAYTTVRLKLGLKKPLRFLLAADHHLIFFDGRDNEVKRAISERRHREFTVNNVGRNLPYFLEAIAYVKKECDLLLHAGDLIDMVSEQNLEVVKLLLADVDYFFACGNHEYTHYSGQHPETAEECAYAYQMTPRYFRHSLEFASREINGLNLVSLYNGEYQITAEQLDKLRNEVDKGLPVFLMVHNPFFTPGIYRYRIEVEKENRCSLVGCPDEILNQLPDWGASIRPNAETMAFINYMKNQPLIKAVLCGHVHLHKNYNDILYGETRQYVVGGGYYGCGIVFEVA